MYAEKKKLVAFEMWIFLQRCAIVAEVDRRLKQKEKRKS